MQPVTTYGDFTEIVSEQGLEGLTLVFSPTSISLKERWKNNSLSADFMGDYFANFFTAGSTGGSTKEPSRESGGESGAESGDGPGRREVVKSAVSFVANELIENAMKFSDEGPTPISIRLTMLAGELVFCATNGTSQKNAARYQEAVQSLLTGDLWAEYEKRASTKGKDSGMGLLSMLTDYSARIGWRFLPQDEMRALVITTVRIPL